MTSVIQFPFCVSRIGSHEPMSKRTGIPSAPPSGERLFNHRDHRDRRGIHGEKNSASFRDIDIRMRDMFRVLAPN